MFVNQVAKKVVKMEDFYFRDSGFSTHYPEHLKGAEIPDDTLFQLSIHEGSSICRLLVDIAPQQLATFLILVRNVGRLLLRQNSCETAKPTPAGAQPNHDCLVFTVDIAPAGKLAFVETIGFQCSQLFRRMSLRLASVDFCSRVQRVRKYRWCQQMKKMSFSTWNSQFSIFLAMEPKLSNAL